MVENRTNRTWLRRSALALAAAAALAGVILTPTHAQQGGTIAGRVTDSSGEPLPGVAVVTANPGATEADRLRWFTTTDRQGRYRVTNLQAGTYSVTVSLPGFGSAARNDVEVPASSNQVVDFELAPGFDADVPVTISPPVTSGMGFGHALDCALPPSGAIEDCRPVVVGARIFH